MKKIYINKVVSLLGGLIDNSELKIVEDCYNQGLAPAQAAQVVINNR